MEANDLSQAVNDTLSKLDFGDLENLSVFGGSDFWTVLGQILSGEYFKQYPDVISGIWGLLGNIILAVLPLVVLVVAITILCGFVGTAKKKNLETALAAGKTGKADGRKTLLDSR